MRTRNLFVPLSAVLLLTTLVASANVFQLSTGSTDLQEVTSTVEVYFKSMRFNRASNSWNFELTVRNSAVAPLASPVVVLVDAFQNTTGPLGPDGRDEQGKGWYDVSNLIPSGGLFAGQESAARTLGLGLSSGVPQLTVKVFAIALTNGPAFAFVRTLDEIGQPLPGVAVFESGPEGQGTNTTDSRFGVATIGYGAGINNFAFTAPGFFPAWRQQSLTAGAVQEIASPRLLKRGTNSVSIGSSGGVLSSAVGNIQITIPAGASMGTATLAPTTSQTLPALLPSGWSPLQAFWLELANEPASAIAGQFDLWRPLASGETAALVRWNANSAQWIVTQLVNGLGAAHVNVVLPGSGGWALVARDNGTPSPQVGQPLPAPITPRPDYTQLNVSSTVTPSTSAPSKQPELVTATAMLIISNKAGALSSGTLLRAKVTERYHMRDGSMRVTPSYETWFVGYRPGNNSSILQAEFPLRPLLLLGGEELSLGLVNVDILPPTSFAGALITSGGGVADSGPVHLVGSAGSVDRPEALQLASVPLTNFTSLSGNGLSITNAFQLTLGRLVPDTQLGLQISNLPPNSKFVLARVIAYSGVYGLEPVARLATDSQSSLISLEPTTDPKLLGLTGSGQYVLAQVAASQTLVSGSARNSQNNLVAGLIVRLGPWVTLTETNGSYRLLAPAGNTALNLTDPHTGDTSTLAVTVPPNQPSLVLPEQVVASVGPSAMTVSPGQGSTNVPLVASITITFSKPVNPATLISNALQLIGPGASSVASSFSLNLRGDQATLLPLNPLAAQTGYSVILSTNIADLSGRKLIGQNQFTFTTAAAAFVRSAGAELITYEPTNSITRMCGTAGFAQPNQPVVLVNETSGRTTTVLAKADGSFDGAIEAGLNDQVSVTVLNENGSRDTITPNRQMFADGSVGLFPSGGTIEVQGETGLTQFIVEPGAIGAKTKLKFEPVSKAQMSTLVTNAPVDGGKVLGGFKMAAIQGSQLTRSIDVSFPIDLSTVLPPGVSPTNCGFGLCIVRHVDGDQVFELVDRMLYENGRLVTHSPPFFGLLGGPYEDILVAPLLMFLNFTPLMVHGQVYSQEWDPVTNAPVANAARTFLTGALVTGKPFSSAIQLRGRLRPGAVYTASGAYGAFTLYLPAPFETPSPYIGLEATHPNFPGVKAKSVLPELSNGDRFTIGNVLDKRHLVFPILPASQHPVPVIAVSHAPESPDALQEATVTAIVTAGDSAPEVGVTIDSVQPLPGGSSISKNDVIVRPGVNEQLTPQSRRQTFTVKSARAGYVLLRISTFDVNGTTPPVMHPVIFGLLPPPPKENPPPADAKDKTGPRVLTMSPTPGSTGVGPGQPIFVRFNEAIKREILNEPFAITLNPPAGQPRMDLSADQRELQLDFPDLQPGTTYTLTIGYYARDLNDNPLDQDPTVDGDQAFEARFTTAPVLSYNLPGISPSGGVGAVLHGGYAFVLERRGTDRGRLVAFDLTNPQVPKQVGEYSLPAFPRDVAFIPQYRYVTTNGLSNDPNYLPVLGDITNVVTHNLVAVVGGLAGLGQFQWLRLLDVTDPKSPKFVSGAVISFDGLALPGRLRWVPPMLGYMETGTPDRINLVNLQAFIISDLLVRNQPEYKRLPADGDPGLDADHDGSYVSPGDRLPLPAHLPLDFGGKVEIVTVPDTTQGIIDFSIDNGGDYVGAILQSGYVRGRNGQADTSQPINPCYRTLESGGLILPRALASLEISNGIPRRMQTLFNFPMTISNSVSALDLVLISVRGQDTNYLDVLDVTDRLKVGLLSAIPLPKLPGDDEINSIIRREDGLLAIACSNVTYLVDPVHLIDKPIPGTTHPAIVGSITGLGGNPRTFDSQPTGLNVTGNLDGKALLVQTAPLLSFVRFPNDTPFAPERLATNSSSDLARILARLQHVDSLDLARMRNPGVCPTPLLTNLDGRTHYYLLLEAPGGAGTNIELSLESLNEAGRPLPNRGFLFPPVHALSPDALAALVQTPGTNDAPVRSLRAWRISNDASSPFFNFFLSRPFVTVAEEMTRQDLQAVQGQLDREVLWSGAWIRGGIDPQMQNNPVLGPFASTVDLGERVVASGVEALATAFPADLIPSQNPGPTVGEMTLPTALESVSAHNRELVINATDLSLPGRRMPLEFRRTYRGQSLYHGPFGRGWDFNFNQRLVTALPQCLTVTSRANDADSDTATKGDILFYNGGGEVVIFKDVGSNAPPEITADPLFQNLQWKPRIARYYMPPSGLFSPMFRFKDGRYVRLEPDGKQYWFNPLGRLEKIYDRYDQNSIELVYSQKGELSRIYDELHRPLDIGYYRAPGDSNFRFGVDERTTRAPLFGLIARLKDYSNRDCLYNYDDQGLLVSKQTPKIETASPTGFTGRQEVVYTYSGTDDPLKTGQSLTGVRGPEIGGVPAVAISKFGQNGRDTVAELTVAGRALTVSSSIPNTAQAMSFGGAQSTVINNDASQSKMLFDRFGRVTNAVLSGSSGLTQTNRQEFYDNGMIKAVVDGEGNRTEFSYDDSNASFRSRGNLLKIRRVPGPRGGPTIEASTHYDSWYNLEAGDKFDFNNVAATIVLQDDHRDVHYITRGGEREFFGVNEFGQLTSHTTIDGITTTLQYNGQTGFPTYRSVGTMQYTISYAPLSGATSDPGSRGKPSQVTDPDGISTTFIYNEHDQIVSESRAVSLVTHAYDAVGNLSRRVTTVETNRAVVEEFDYLPVGFLKEHRVKDVETEDGVADLVTKYEPDSMYRVKHVTMPSGEEHFFDYDHLGRLINDRVPSSHTNSFVYDRNGNTVGISRDGVLEQYAFDGLDRQVATIAANGSVNQVLYDGNGNILTNRIIDAQGKLLAENRMEYDALNRARRFYRLRNNGTSFASIDFDSAHRSITATDALGATATTHLDEMGRPALFVGPNQQVSFTNDLRGNLIGKKTQEDRSFAETYRYNDRNQLESIIDGLGHESRNTLEVDGRVVATKDREQHVSRTAYSILGERLAAIEANGVGVTNKFNLGRRVSAIRDPQARQTSFQYDSQGRLLTNTLPNGQQTVFLGFTSQDQPTQIQMPRGISVSIGYDFEGKMTNRVISGFGPRREEQITYDGARRIDTTSDPAGTTHFTYDLGGFVRQVDSEYHFGSDPVLSSVLTFNIKQDADAANFRSQLTYADGATVLNYKRDISGRLIGLSPATGEPVIKTNLWVGDQRLGSSVLGTDRIRLELVYDSLRRVVGRRYVNIANGQALVDVRYAYDNNGAILARQHVHRGGRTDLFEYDEAYNLLRADLNARPTLDADDPVRNFPQFSPNPELPGTWQPGSYARRAMYSAADHLDQLNLINPAGLRVAPMVTNMAGVDALLCSTNLDNFARSLDEIGDVTRTLLSVRIPGQAGPVVVPAALAYNDLGQLASVTRDDGVRVVNEYNHAGLRIRRAVTGSAALCVPSDVAFIYDGDRLLEERDLSHSAELMRRYYYGDDGDELLAADIRLSNGGPLQRYYFLTDQQRSVMAVADATGTAVERATYDPWGQPRLELADTLAPVVSSIRRESNGLTIVFSEPILPKSPGNQLESLIISLPGLSAGFHLTTPGGEISGQWLLDESKTDAGFGSVVRFFANSGISGTANLAIGGGKLQDEWGNLNAGSTNSINLTSSAGTTLYTGAVPGSTAATVLSRSSVGNSIWFHGQVYDWETGLVYCRARFYDPYTGTFLQRDPSGFDDSVNQYAGFGNNPINFRDPTGASILQTMSEYGQEISATGREMQRDGLVWYWIGTKVEAVGNLMQLPAATQESWDTLGANGQGGTLEMLNKIRAAEVVVVGGVLAFHVVKAGVPSVASVMASGARGIRNGIKNRWARWRSTRTSHDFLYQRGLTHAEAEASINFGHYIKSQYNAEHVEIAVRGFGEKATQRRFWREIGLAGKAEWAKTKTGVGALLRFVIQWGKERIQRFFTGDIDLFSIKVDGRTLSNQEVLALLPKYNELHAEAHRRLGMRGRPTAAALHGAHVNYPELYGSKLNQNHLGHYIASEESEVANRPGYGEFNAKMNPGAVPHDEKLLKIVGKSTSPDVFAIRIGANGRVDAYQLDISAVKNSIDEASDKFYHRTGKSLADYGFYDRLKQ